MFFLFNEPICAETRGGRRTSSLPNITQAYRMRFSLISLFSRALCQTALIAYDDSLPPFLIATSTTPTTSIDCVLGPTSQFGSCSAPRCGGRAGVQLQLQSISTAPTNGGRACPPLSERTLFQSCVSTDLRVCGILCENGASDVGETDIDCGGTDCVRCGGGRDCIGTDDCADGLVCGDTSTCIVARVLTTLALVTGPSLTITIPFADVNTNNVGPGVLAGLTTLVGALAGAPSASVFLSHVTSTQLFPVSPLRAPTATATALQISFGILAATAEDASLYASSVNARGGELVLLVADILALSLPQLEVVELVNAAVATGNTFAAEPPLPPPPVPPTPPPTPPESPSITPTLTPSQSSSPTASPSQTQTVTRTRTQSGTVSPSRTASSSVTPRSTVAYRDRAQASQDSTVLAADAAVAAGGGLTTIILVTVGCAFLLAFLYVRGRALCDRIRAVYGRGRR